jgi:hypothetical protein
MARQYIKSEVRATMVDLFCDDQALTLDYSPFCASVFSFHRHT